MRVHSIIIFILLVSVSKLYSQDSIDTSGPIIEFDSRIIDFGTLEYGGGDIRKKVTIYNRGSAQLLITHVRHSDHMGHTFNSYELISHYANLLGISIEKDDTTEEGGAGKESIFKKCPKSKKQLLCDIEIAIETTE